MNKQTRNLAQFLAMGLLSLAMPMAAMGQLTPDAKPEPKEESKSSKAPKSVSEVPAEKKIIYRVDLNGLFGHEVTATPMKSVLEDAKKWNPDYLVFYCNFGFRGRRAGGIQDWMQSPDSAAYAYNQMETARELQTLFTDGIRDDPKWVTRDGKKPEVIMWVKRAMGGSAFLPFVSPKIYYTSDARHGGIGFLEYIIGYGDETPRQKQFSLRLGRAEGLAYKGGHEPKIIRAMCRMDYVLSVSYVGGKPVFFENYDGDELLTDTGLGGEADDSEEVIRFEGNDNLNLTATTALKLKVSSGTIDTNEDLAEALDVARSYQIITGRPQEIIGKWGKDVRKAEGNLNSLNREFERTPIEGRTPEERNVGRNKRIRLLKEMAEIYKKYSEAIDREAVRTVPDPADIDIMIEQLKQAIRQDR